MICTKKISTDDDQEIKKEKKNLHRRFNLQMCTWFDN